MIWVPNTLDLPHWDKLTRYTLGWVGGQCECQSLNHPAPRPQTQAYTSHQSFGSPLKPIGQWLSTNLGQNWHKSSPRGWLVVPWCHFGRVCVQCGPNICKDPSPWPPNQSYVSRQSYETPRHTTYDLVLV